MPNTYRTRANAHLTILTDRYVCLNRSAVLQYGMWDQIRVDHGREFYLTLFMQQRNMALRYNCNRTPSLQTASTQAKEIMFTLFKTKSSMISEFNVTSLKNVRYM